MDENQEKVRRVTVEIPDRAWEVAARFVPEGATADERLPSLIAAAFEEWVHWMEGSFRPTSISELETSRAYKLYDRLSSSSDWFSPGTSTPTITIRYSLSLWSLYPWVP